MNHASYQNESALNQNLRVLLVFVASAILLSVGFTATAYASSESEPNYFKKKISTSRNHAHPKQLIEVDIVENPRKFSFDETPAFDDGSPAYGGEFVTQGYIYKKGTLELGDGVDADGNPEFPERVIGTWFCRGWHVGNGARTLSGPSVITHQLFNFGTAYGEQTIATDGLELADLDVPILRAITGGTGHFKYARGEQVQSLQGINQFSTDDGDLVGVKLRIKLKIH